jgi:hypothetical protein
MAVKQFSDLELFRMFNVECAPNIPHERGERRPGSDAPYDFNDIRVRLWKIKKATPSRGFAKALQSEDYCSVSEHPPGSAGRIADLAAHYASQEGSVGPQGEATYLGDAESAFEIPTHIECPSCGWHLDPESNYCTECGHEL